MNFINETSSDDSYIWENRPQYLAFLCISVVIFTFGCVTNLAVIIRLLRQGVLRARIRMLLFSLSLADLLYILLEFPLNQFVWLSTVFWTTGDVTCRLSAFARGFSAYLIAYILVVVRYVCITKLTVNYCWNVQIVRVGDKIANIFAWPAFSNAIFVYTVPVHN